MRIISSISLFILSSAILASCTKVIDVKLRDADKKYVIEGTLTDQPGNTTVLISQTKNFNDANDFIGTSGASVVITDNATGVSTMLTETTPGNYSNSSLTGAPGKAYTLKVVVGGQTFTAISTMPQKIAFDTLYITEDMFFGRASNIANIGFTDPAGLGNCYDAHLYVNGKKVKQIFVTNDDYFDNKYIESKLFTNPGGDDKDKAKTGDSIRVDMLCVDPAIYKYWFSLQQSATGSNQSAAPANPVTNISGGALGYFTAQTMETKSVVVP